MKVEILICEHIIFIIESKRIATKLMSLRVAGLICPCESPCDESLT